jgi:cyanophycinase-like exopeptidase
LVFNGELWMGWGLLSGVVVESCPNRREVFRRMVAVIGIRERAVLMLACSAMISVEKKDKVV